MFRFTVFLLSIVCFADEVSQKAEAIIKTNCQTCHGAALQMSKLDLRTRESMLKGGEHGSALTPGNAETSRIYRFAAGIDQPSMPPGKKMATEDLEILKKWIESGASFSSDSSESVDKQATLAKLEARPILPEERKFWAYLPVQKSSAKSIDELWMASLTKKNLKPNAEADRRTLIRRVYFDLIGLPPSPAEVQSFIRDRSPNAFTKVVDRLLASPQYGERWGRHWLDLVRYSDSTGYEFDRDRPTAHLYRDWVVQAFNKDMPYDEFVRQQIAGDQIHPGNRDSVIATSYLRLGPEANIKTTQTRMDELDDIIATTTGSLLGMTVSCARCHNHKFDAIPQKDYYRMQAVFFSAKPADIPIVGEEEIQAHKQKLAAWESQIQPVRDQKTQLEDPYRNRLLAEKKDRLADYIKIALATPPEKRTEGQRLNALQVEKTLRVDDAEIEKALSVEDQARWNALKKDIKALEKQKPVLPTALGVLEKKTEPSYFLHHGSADSPGSLMKPGVLSVITPGEWEAPAGVPARQAFAEWITAPDNPLTPRVMVNRIWQHHFGEGLVRTTSNFGTTGEKPSHPELLDWLSSQFIHQGWSIKKMHRMILLSRAYRMSSNDQEAGLQTDPENRLLWRQSRRRLEGEAIRDAILQAAGTLDTKIGGPGFHPYIDPSLWAGSSGRTWDGKEIDDPSTWRRSIYIFQKRTIQVPMMELFDAPNGIGACARRNRSTIATQALILMNNAFVLDQAARFADRLKKEAGEDQSRQINLAFQLTLSRPPSATELDAALSFIKQSPEGMRDFAHAIFNLNEFAYIQ